MTGWLRAYKREVRGAKVWALHNFKDATSQYTRGAARAFVRMVRGPVWLIETGGIRSRGGLQGQSPQRQAELRARRAPTARSNASTSTGGGRSATATGTPHSCRPPASAAPPTTRCATACAAAEPVSSRRCALPSGRHATLSTRGPWPARSRATRRKSRASRRPVANESPARPTPRRSPAPGEPARVGSLRPSRRPPGDRPRRSRILAGFSGNTRLDGERVRRVAPLAHTP